jgi:hypothetical protein
MVTFTIHAPSHASSHFAARKGQNETARVVTILQQLRDELTARFFTVLENHRHSFFLSLAWISLRGLLEESARDADADQEYGEQN